MTDKQIIIDGVDVSGCKHFKIGTCLADYLFTDMAFSEAKCELCEDCYYKQLKRKEQGCNKLYIQLKADEEYYKEEENTLRKIIKNKEERNIELYKENNKLKVKNEELKRKITKIFACLIKANKDKIIDTLWVDNVTTLWDYVALTLGVEGDQTQIEEQLIQKISEVLDD